MRYLSFDIHDAKQDPTHIFNHPRDVLCVVNLSDEERLDILARWREQLLDDTDMPVIQLRNLLDAIERAMGEIEAASFSAPMTADAMQRTASWQ